MQVFHDIHPAKLFKGSCDQQKGKLPIFLITKALTASQSRNGTQHEVLLMSGFGQNALDGLIYSQATALLLQTQWHFQLHRAQTLVPLE